MCNHAVVVLHILEVKECDRYILAILPKRIAVLIKYEFFKTLVCRHKVMGLHGLHRTSETINHLLSIAGRDLRIKS